jgi:hypothetical protein
MFLLFVFQLLQMVVDPFFLHFMLFPEDIQSSYIVATRQNPRATWTAMPTAETSCATCNVVFQLIPPPKALSGTSTMSPG